MKLQVFEVSYHLVFVLRSFINLTHDREELNYIVFTSFVLLYFSYLKIFSPVLNYQYYMEQRNLLKEGQSGKADRVKTDQPVPKGG